MVHILTSMRSAALRNMRRTTAGLVSVLIVSLIGLVVSATTLLLGFTAPVAGGSDQLALVLLAWAAGRIGFAGFSGSDPALPLDIFRTLPLERRRLARALLIVGLADPSLVLLLIASGSLVAFGFRLGVVAGVTAVIGAVLYLGATSVASTIVAGLVPADARRRRDTGTVLAAVLMSAVLVSGTLIPTLLSTLANGRPRWLAVALRILPTGWAPDAVGLVGRGAILAAAGMLLLLLLAVLALAASWPIVLGRRLESSGGTQRRHVRAAGRRLLPATGVGAVASREVRLWLRDPIRSGFLLVAFLVGLGVCVVPLFTRGADVMLPFAGAGTALIAGAIAGNSYGFDGPAFGLILTLSSAARAEVRGRQLAWLLLVGPYALVLSVAGLLAAGSGVEWAWVLALTPAVLGTAAGVSALVSTVAPQPLDDSGGPTPAWTLKVYATLILTAVLTAPGLVVLIIGTVSDTMWLTWLAVPVSVGIGSSAAIILGRIAMRRLDRTGPEMLGALTARSTAG